MGRASRTRARRAGFTRDDGSAVVYAALLFVVLLLALRAGTAHGQPPSANAELAQGELHSRGLSGARLQHLASALSSDDAQARAAAVNALLGLHAESLPGITERLSALRAVRPPPERVLEIMTALRHAAGSRRADDNVDRQRGVLPLLAQDRSQAVRSVIEPLLLLRALERIGSFEALVKAADVLALDAGGSWDHEARLLRERGGLKLLPALIALRSHAESRVRNWAQQGVRALGMEDPAVATTLEDPSLVAAVVRAYSEPLDFPAMPVVVRLVASDKLQVQNAARAAVARFGRNAIWQLRTLYEEVAGQRASADWDAARTSSELYAVLDRAATEEGDTLLAQGMAHFVAGRLEPMAESYDRLLALFPFYGERAKLAPGYAALGQDKLARDRKSGETAGKELSAARDAYQRALRLAPKAPDAPRWRAQLAFIDAELSLSRGVVDLKLYERALAHDPEHAAAAQAKDRLSGAAAARDRTRKKLAALGALALLGGVAVLLLKKPRAYKNPPVVHARNQ
jgi:tetratricopeptide (TPR) repeat protein